jgi:hypothetical protein
MEEGCGGMPEEARLMRKGFFSPLIISRAATLETNSEK